MMDEEPNASGSIAVSASNTEERFPELEPARLYWTVLILLSVLITNHLGMKWLLGTGPSENLAPLFVAGVGAFWTQFQVLGLFAALLPYRLCWRMIIPLGLVLILCADILYFRSRVGVDGVSYVALMGFLTSILCFLLIRSVFGVVIRDKVRASRAAEVETSRLGIQDIFAITTVVALVMILLRIDLNKVDLLRICYATLFVSLIYLGMTVLLALPHLMMRGHSIRKWMCFGCIQFFVWGIPLIFIGVVAIGRMKANFHNWPYLFCLTIGAEIAWVIGLICLRLLGYQMVLLKDDVGSFRCKTDI